MTNKLNVLQVIPKLGYGGAETGCYDIAHFLPENDCGSFIATSGGELLKFVKKDKGVGFSRIGTTFIVGDYKFENTKEFSTFSKKNVDDLKEGKSISGSGDLRVTGRARVDNQLIVNAGIVLVGGITGSIDGGSF